MLDKNAVICLEKQENYDVEALKTLLSRFFDQMELPEGFFRGKRVVIKPNLVRKMDAALGGTTHPAVLEAAAAVLRERGADDLLIAESPGGLYTESALRNAYGVTYRGCGIADAAGRAGVPLNYDTSAVMLEAPEGRLSKMFHIIKPIAEADVIVNLCKLKSHGLTMMSAATKNYFGTVPGTEKFEMHARFPDLTDFSGMIVDLCGFLCSRAETINIVDGIVGMEGNGPTNGSPRKIGIVAASRNPFAVDAVCQRILCMEGRVKMLEIAEERGFFDPANLRVIGERIEDVKVEDFVLPDSSIQVTSVLANAKFLRIFKPSPVVDKSVCIGCGECVRSCPKHTITLDKEKHLATIHKGDCIRCFCCQELCPHDAVRIKRNVLLKWIK